MEANNNTIQMTTQIIQYDYNYIMSIRCKVSNRLPLNVFNKIMSYQKFGRKKSNSKLNKFLLTRNPEAVDVEEVKKEVKKEMRAILNRLTERNLDSMKDKINSIITLVNKVRVKTELHKLLMSMLLETAVTNKPWAKTYAKVLEDMSLKVDLDYRDYLDNLFVDIKKSNSANSYSNDYNKFCKQIADKDKFVGLFVFIGELHKMDMLETVLIKKYLMILMHNITDGDFKNGLDMETNAHCIKGLLTICNNPSLYDIVYPKFKKMKSDKKYNMKFRFILMDITEKYEKLKN